MKCPSCGEALAVAAERCPGCGAVVAPPVEGALAPNPRTVTPPPRESVEPLRDIPGMPKKERTWRDEVQERVRKRRKKRAQSSLPLFEQPGVTCDDGMDNDCDGQADCDDINCPSDPACAICGNSLCESGENCNTCSADCPGKTGGKPADRYCCGNGVAEGPEGNGAICDGNY